MKYDLDQERGFFRLQIGDVRPEVVDAVVHLSRKEGAHHQLSSAIGVGRKIPDGTELARSMDLEHEYRLAAGATHGAYWAQAFLVRAPDRSPASRLSVQLAPLQSALIATAHAWRAFAAIAYPTQIELVAERIESARAVLKVAPELVAPRRDDVA